VHREREDRLVAGEYRGRAVALVHVEIDDERAADPAIALQHADRDGDVVQRAEPFSVVGERVMRAAREVAREPVLERRPARVQCALRQAAGPARAAPTSRRSGAEYGVSVPCAKASRRRQRVHERQVLDGCASGYPASVGSTAGRKQFLEQRCWTSGPVRRRQRQVVVAVMIQQSYRHETSDLSSLERVT
jgi:hypothetical protein